ncbi:tRNA (guanine-N1)-methyltransferase [Flavobacteriaceae bacterium F08102]|nr:tRNA (guanine-N1)-methyltransferase [Flavobacteriaceae bacterium F08102]
MKLSRILIPFFAFFCTIHTNAQEDETGSLNSGTIESQFEYLYKKSPRWEDYRSVKTNNLFKFRDNVLDSLKLARKIYNESQKVVGAQKAVIDSLNLKLIETKENLKLVTAEKDTIHFLGIPLSKTGYNSILWSIIGVLGALLALFIGRFKRSNAITIQANKDRQEIEEEYEAHRQRALEREQKLRRELQDELNKQKYASQPGTKKSTK